MPFEVYLTEEQRKLFLNLTQRDPGQAMLIFSRISTRQSTCWVLNDQLRIHSLIESSVGFEAVDSQVHEAIAKALQPQDTTLHVAGTITAAAASQECLSVEVASEKRDIIMRWFRDIGLVKEFAAPEKVEKVLLTFK